MAIHSIDFYVQEQIKHGKYFEKFFDGCENVSLISMISNMTGTVHNGKGRSAVPVYDCFRMADSCRWLRNILMKHDRLIHESI